jgi:hypothetical protein
MVLLMTIDYRLSQLELLEAEAIHEPYSKLSEID